MKNLQYFPYERNQYYYGKLITQQDFVSEQQYMNDKRRLINRFLHGVGVAAGLQVVRMDEYSFSLEAGLALDEAGREIVVDKPTVQRLDRLDGYAELLERPGADLAYLCLSYEEEDVYPSRSMAQKDSGKAKVFEKTRESFRLWLTSVPYEETGDTLRSFSIRRTALYENEDLVITQDVPAFVQAGERFEARVRISAKRPVKNAEVSFEELLSCLLHEGQDKIKGSWSGSLKERGDSAELVFKLEAFSIEQGIGEMTVLPYKLTVKLGEQLLSSRTELKSEIHISSRDTWNELMDSYYDNAMNNVIANTYPRGIYLAAFHLKQAGRDYTIDRVEPLPFEQRVYNSFLDMSLASMLLRKIRMLETARALPADGGQGAKEKTAEKAERASGVCTISVGIGGKAGDRFFSGEIVHGLGLGNVDVRISLEQGEYQYAGSPEIFEDMSFKAESAVKINRERGSFMIGIRFIEASAVKEVRVHWIAEKAPDTAEADREAHIRVLPDKPELMVMQSRYFRVQTENLEGMTILWEVVTPEGGIITRDGHYTAPDTAGIYEVCAFCQEMPKIRNSVFVIVRE